MQTFLGILGFAFGVAGVTSILAHNYFVVEYAMAGCLRLTEPMCIVKINNHGAISYISEEQSHLLSMLMAGFIISTTLATALFVVTQNSRPERTG